MNLTIVCIWYHGRKVEHTPVDEDGISFQRNGNVQLGGKLILEPMEVDFRLGEETLPGLPEPGVGQTLSCGKR